MTAPLTLHPSLRTLLPDLARFETTRELEQSSSFRKLQPEIGRILGQIWQETLVPAPVAATGPIRVVAWNIERGIQVDAIISILQEHPSLRNADVLLLSELDWGMARTGNRFIAREIAAALGMNYAFAPCYMALSKGAGVEKDAEGENTESLHGIAVLSRYPIRQVQAVPLPNGKDKMRGAEKRIGSLRALIADLEHPQGLFRAVSLHLDSHSSQAHRHLQMCRVLDHLEKCTPAMKTVIGGDWNTSTHDASRALYAILGYCRRVLMGIRHVIANHYPYPERWFERRLFRELDRRGYNYRDLNNPGECTLHYNMNDLATNLNVGEWLPRWCFWFITWALKRTGGTCSLKLDWFAVKGFEQAGDMRAVGGLKVNGRAVSDHDPIVVSLRKTPGEN
jgi:endonuclease/exonuclease/phosphatase family metal-dependent hydrolase